MSPIKVSRPETLSGSQAIVCRGRLALIVASDKDLSSIPEEGIRGEYVWLDKDMFEGMPVKECYKPIIISEVEDMEHGKCYDSIGGAIEETYIKMKITEDPQYFKVLALPENFSHEQLRAIVDGKLKDGDEVLVECERVISEQGKHEKKMLEDANDPYPRQVPNSWYDYHIKTDKDGYINVFPVKEEDGWGEIVQKYRISKAYQYSGRDHYKNFVDWAEKENYNPPTRKNQQHGH